MVSNPNRALLGVSISSQPLETLVARAKAAIEERSSLVVACANPHSLVVAHSDELFLNALKACDEVLADGVGVTVACRLAGAARAHRITGHDFFQSIMTGLDRVGGRAFFFGSRSPVLAGIESRMRQDFPHVQVCVLAPPYGDWSDPENEAMLMAIRDARPDVLWVGMTAPRQEKWVYANVHRLQVPVVGSIGAVFDYYAGTVRRAPAWYRDNGVEWLYRLFHEPKRLWRRTLVSAPLFLWLVLRQRLADSRQDIACQ